MKRGIFSKLICILIILTVILPPGADIVCGETGLDYSESFDFGVDVVGFDMPLAKSEGEYGALVTEDGELETCVTQTKAVKMSHHLGETVDDGMFYIAFDYMSADAYNDSYLRLMSGDTQFQICGFRNTGKFGHFKKFSIWALEDTAVSYSPDVWYTVGVLFDMQGNTAYFYFGERGKEVSLIETVTMPEEFGNITDMMLVHSFGEYTPARWDNVRVNRITADTIDGIERRDNIIFSDGIYKKDLKKICDENFEDTFLDVTISGWTDADKSNGMMRVLEENNFVAKTWVDEKYPKRITHTFDKPIKSGLYYIAFDWKSEAIGNDCFVRLMSGDKQYQICGFRNDGRFGRFTNFSNWALNAETAEDYAGNQWYRIGILLDMDLRNIYIYKGEKGEALVLNEKTVMPEEMTDFTDVVFVHSYGNYPAAYWDNIKIYDVEAETAGFIENEENISFDEKLKEPVASKLSTDKKGNIFYNGEIAEVSAEFFSRSVVCRNRSITYNISFNGNKVAEKVFKAEMKPGDKLTDTVSVPLFNGYGYYEIDAKETKTVLSRTRLSNVRAAKDGVRNPKLGATMHMTRVGDKEAAFEILRKGGFTAVRGGQNDWADVEIDAGIFAKDSANEEYYNLAEAEGFDNITILKGSNELYAGEFPSDNPDREGLAESPPRSEEMIERFANYCYETVLMYPQVKYFQIWNEWNNAPTFNNDGITEPEHYAKLLEAGYDAVKKAEEKRGKEALVLAMAPSGTKPTWISGVFEALNGRKCFDIISIHPYTYTNGGENGKSSYKPEDICVRHTDEQGNIVTRIQAVYDAAEKYGYADVPVWAGEFGFSSYLCDEEKQAQYAVRTMALCDGYGVLDKMIWYTFQNHLAVNEREQNFGMVRYDTGEDIPYEAKPVYLAMSNYNAIMAGAEQKEIISSGEDGVYCYEFVTRNGNTLYAVWSSEGICRTKIDAEAKAVDVYDIYGNKTVLLSDGSGIEIDADESIKYVEVKDTYVKLLQGEKEIERADALTGEDVILVADCEKHEKYDVLVAMYNNGIINKAEIYSYDMGSVNLGKIENVDKIELFIWSNYVPLTEKIVIE